MLKPSSPVLIIMAQNNKNSFFTQTFSNVSSNRIEITDDKLENHLNRCVKSIEKGAGWSGWLGLLITCVATVVSVDFFNVKILNKEYWEVIFIILSLIALIKTIECGYYALFKRTTAKTIIEEIKRECLDK